MAIFLSGTSNIELIEKNKKAFPPAFQSGSRLAYYSSLFNSVEINSTFYKLPLPSTLGKWALDVPDGFQFTLKMWKEITHAKHLMFNWADVEKFMRIAGHTGNKKGVLLIQLPAGTQSVQKNQLEMLLSAVESLNSASGTANTGSGTAGGTANIRPNTAGDDLKAATTDPKWRIAVEFRHQSWYDPSVYALLDRYDASLVWHDRPLKGGERKKPHISNAFHHSPFIYLRFHGPHGDYKGSYSHPFLQEKAAQIRSWLDQGKEVYAYFNNTMEGDAPRNLATLNGMVDRFKTGSIFVAES